MLSYKLDFNSCAIRDGFRKSNHILHYIVMNVHTYIHSYVAIVSIQLYTTCTDTELIVTLVLRILNRLKPIMLKNHLLFLPELLKSFTHC